VEPLGLSNPKIKRLRRLLGRRSARLEEGAFVVEGAGLVADAAACGWAIEAQFVAPGGEAVALAAPAFPLAHGVIERVASTESPQPVLAVVRMRHVSTDALALARFVVVADRLADPGNAGTILRSAEASGADAVVLTPGSVDVYNPKVIRASAGALFRIPVIGADIDAVRAAGLRLFGTSSHRGQDYRHVDVAGRVALVFGNEAHGLPDDAPIDEWVTIPHAGRAESLNVAMAATVLCFEVARRSGPAEPA
jgi:RNA methyltransferase, TrmH family